MHFWHTCVVQYSFVTTRRTFFDSSIINCLWAEPPPSNPSLIIWIFHQHTQLQTFHSMLLWEICSRLYLWTYHQKWENYLTNLYIYSFNNWQYFILINQLQNIHTLYVITHFHAGEDHQNNCNRSSLIQYNYYHI